jgi:shikimate kinase
VIALCGFMFCGKTETAGLISAMTGLAFCDTDELIEAEAGLRVFEIFEKYGESGFRELESLTLARFLAKTENAVVSLGGGCAADLNNLELLSRKTFLVYLRASFDEIKRRIGDAPEKELNSRPLAASRDFAALKKLYDSRLEYYEKAELIVDCDGLTPAGTAEKIIEALKLDKDNKKIEI